MFCVTNQFLLKFKRKEMEHFESFSALCEKNTHSARKYSSYPLLSDLERQLSTVTI